MIDKIIPSLWFDDNAQGAMKFYATVFPDSRITEVNPQGVTAKLADVPFIAINGEIKCGNQQEIDYYWDRLTKGGKELQCGWCQDPFGVSWQVVPQHFQELVFSSPDPKKALEAFCKMKKIIIGELENV